MKGITDVYESALKLLVPQNVEETYATVVNEAIKLVGAKYGSIFVPADGKLKRIYTTEKRLYKVKPRKIGLTYQSFKKRTAMLRDGSELADDHKEFDKNPVGTDILIPLTYGHIAIGTLSVMSAPDVKWGVDELNILKIFGPIATLAIRNAHLNNELKHALELRDLFISMAAHELKTPITSIHLYTQMIDKEVKKNKKPKQKTVRTLVNETIRLKRLVNELMDVAYIQQGKLQFKMKKLDIFDLLNEIYEYYLEEYPNYNFNLKIKSRKKRLFLKGDTDKLRQAFSNIINNSIKFSKEGSDIVISVEYQKPNVIIQIKDKGKGIPEEQLPFVFERYYSGNHRKGSSKGGIGLGLSLVKNIVESHKGTVEIESKVNKGTTVIIKLPVHSKKVKSNSKTTLKV